MAYVTDERSLIEGTIRDINDAIAARLDQRRRLDAEIEEMAQRVRHWQTRLSRLEGVGAGPASTKRRPKGENLTSVVALLLDEPQGLPQKEIVTRLGLTASSVRAVLTRHADRFIEDPSGTFRVKVEGVQPG